jgi:hypothetical protein
VGRSEGEWHFPRLVGAVITIFVSLLELRQRNAATEESSLHKPIVLSKSKSSSSVTIGPRGVSVEAAVDNSSVVSSCLMKGELA